MTTIRSRIQLTSKQQLAFVVLILPLAVIFAYPGSGLLVGWSSTEDGGIHRFHAVIWGVHTGLILSAGVLALLIRTEERVATAQQLIVAAVITLAVWYGSVVIPHSGEPTPGFDQVLFGTLILIFIGGVVPALHPRREEILSIEGKINRPMAAFGIIGLVVAAPYALDQIQIQLTADLATDPHSGEQFHWNEMATTALTLPAIALVAAFRNRGWRLVAWTAGLGTMIFGTASVLMPLQASSPGVAWGAVALVGGILFIAVTEIEIRRGPN